MSKRELLICDDEPSRVEGWRSQLSAGPAIRNEYDINTLSTDELRRAASELEERRRRARGNAEGGLTEARLDRVAILVIDFDLIRLFDESYFTGEDLAYLARCYSSCGLIVGLNQFGDGVFDLTLSGHPESFADLNVGGSQIGSSGLWREPWKGFRPWLWPLLPSSYRQFERRSRELASGLDRKVVEVLDLPPHLIVSLSRKAAEFIAPQAELEDVTIRQFVMDSGQGLRRKDLALSEGSIARIAAARLGKWLERFVLSGQDILIDAPHLVSRYPSLLKGKRTSRKAWNQTASLRHAGSLGIDNRRIAGAQYRNSEWVSRPVWYLDDIRSNSKIAEVSDPWSHIEKDFVFCEDISQFLPREQAREFVADLESQFARRFVADQSRVTIKSIRKAISEIEYRPQVRFSI